MVAREADSIALGVAAAIGTLLVYIVHSIAAVADQGGVFEIATRNVLGLLPGLIGAVAGALLGQRLFRQRLEHDHGNT